MKRASPPYPLLLARETDSAWTRKKTFSAMDTEKNLQRQHEALRTMSGEAWDLMFQRLVRHAEFVVRRYRTLLRGFTLPGGRTPEDVVGDAIRASFDGTRAWDPEEQPDLFCHLKSVVDSCVWALVQRSERKRRRALPIGDEEEDPFASVPDDSDSPIEYVITDECGDELDRLVREAVQSDDCMAWVAQVLQGEATFDEVAEAFAMEKTEVYQKRQTLVRRLRKTVPDHPCWSSRHLN